MNIYPVLPTSDGMKTKSNEIRVSSRGTIKSLVRHIKEVIEEDKKSSVVLNAIGRSIPMTLTASEIVRRNIKGLHHYQTITNAAIKDPEDPGNSSLVVSVKIVLSKSELPGEKGVHQEPVSAKNLVNEEGLEALVRAANPRKGPPRRQNSIGSGKSGKESAAKGKKPKKAKSSATTGTTSSKGSKSSAKKKASDVDGKNKNNSKDKKTRGSSPAQKQRQRA